MAVSACLRLVSATGPARRAGLRRYAAIGVERVFIWPIAHANAQIEIFLRDVVPRV